ncbi:MAG TPA: LuxR C-terminal-related transcriptional regulator [Burkholderiales bacterium]|nr:LuxR C-terminal-related transcriptional regulator [Burkholderiales bacterium]
MDNRWSEILLELYSAESLEDFRTRALTVVRREFGGELTCHNEINLANGDSLSALSDSIPEFGALRPAFFEHVEQHPSVQHILKVNGAEPIALKTSDFVSQRRWRNSGLYTQFYRPLADVRYQLTIGQRFDDRLVFFAISRQHRDFSEDERALLTGLRPHFIQAYRNASARSELAQLRAAAERDAETQLARGEGAVFALIARFGLTRREAQVLFELGQGKSNEGIAETLGISLSTVKTRLESVFRRLGVTSRTAAALRVLRAPQDALSPGRERRPS